MLCRHTEDQVRQIKLHLFDRNTMARMAMGEQIVRGTAMRRLERECHPKGFDLFVIPPVKYRYGISAIEFGLPIFPVRVDRVAGPRKMEIFEGFPSFFC